MEILDLFAGPIIIVESHREQGEVRIFIGNQLLPSINSPDPNEECVKRSYERMDLSTTPSADSTSS